MSKGGHLYNFDCNVQMEVHSCPSCGMPYAAPVNFFRRINNGQEDNSWCCPRGHSVHFSDPEVNRLKRRLEQVETSRDRYRNEAETNENRRRAQKAVTTKLKNRVANGVCPCCNRYFKNLHQHMKSQHQGYNKNLTLQKILEIRGWTQGKAAKEIDIKASYISLFINKKPLSATKYQKIEKWVNEQ